MQKQVCQLVRWLLLPNQCQATGSNTTLTLLSLSIRRSFIVGRLCCPAFLVSR